MQTRYQVQILPSGLTVASAEMPEMASVNTGIWVGVGSRYETPQLNGICHFIEHLLFKGTHSRSPREISAEIEGYGGSLNAFTNEEMTCFHARSRHDRFDQVIEVLADMLLNSKFAPVEVAREREVIKQEIAMCRDDPEHHVEDLLIETMWPDHPLGRPITGTEQSLETITRRDALSCMRQQYVAAGTVLVVAGRVSHHKVVRAAKRFASRIPAGPRPQFVPARDHQTTPAIRLVTRRMEQTQLALGIRACSRHDPRRFALRVLNVILGENMSSRLFQTVREEHGLAYAIYSTLNFLHDTGSIEITASLDTAHVERALRLIVRELQRLARQRPSLSELRRAQEYLVGQIELSLESPENQLSWVGEDLIGYGRIFPPAIIKRRLCSVTAGDVRACARDFLRADRLSLAMVSPMRRSGHAAGLLRL